MEGGSRCVAVSATPPIAGLQLLIARKLLKRGALEMESIPGEDGGDIVIVQLRRLDEAVSLRTALNGKLVKRLAGAQLRVAFAPESLLSYLRLSSPTAAPAPAPRLETFSVAPRFTPGLLSVRVSVRGTSSVEPLQRASIAVLPADSIYEAAPALLSSVPSFNSNTSASSSSASSQAPFASATSAFNAIPRSPQPSTPKSPSLLRTSSPMFASLRSSAVTNTQRY